VSGSGSVQRNGKGQVISNYFFLFQKSTLLSQETGWLSDTYNFFVFSLNLIENSYSSVVSFLNRKVDTKSSRGEVY